MSLRVLGYDLDRCIEWKYSEVNIEELIIPSFRRQVEWLSPSSLAWLKRKILVGLSSESGTQKLPARIYISRANASGRRVTNEDEVLDFLDAFGFKVFELENLSFSEQVRLFSNAKLIAFRKSGRLEKYRY